MKVQSYLEKARQGQLERDKFRSKIQKALQKLSRMNYFVSLSNQEPPERGVLQGLPISVKDCICTKGIQSTAGSAILKGYKPPFDATVVKKVKQSGGWIIGKTTQDEFGFGTHSTNCAYGVPRNPWQPDASCGGSSGGAAGLTAALAGLKLPHLALAESTGGSISCPASFCGVVGLTPTYGLVSRWGLIDYANSLDKIGSIGESCKDAALLLSIIAGKDERDQTSIKKINIENLEAKAKGIRLALPQEYFDAASEPIRRKVWKAVKKLEEQGASYEEVSLELTKPALPAYYILACSEASTNLAKFCGMRYGLHFKLKGSFNSYFSLVRNKGFGREAKRRLMLGTYARMAGYRKKYYLKAARVRKLVIKEFKELFSSFDLVAAPSMPLVAPSFRKISELSPLEIYKMDLLTVPANLAGLPQLSLPCGFVNRRPVGLHLVGDHLAERKVLEAGLSYEEARGPISYPKI